MIAAEAEDIMKVIAEAVETERIAKQKENAANQYSEPCNNKLLQPAKRDPNTHAVSTKAAELFNTNRTYIHEAAPAFIYITAPAPENETISTSALISICVKVRSSRVGHLGKSKKERPRSKC